MKISVNWIQEILGHSLSVSAEDLSKILLNLGFEVTHAQHTPKCAGVVLGQILKISSHPNADRLRIVDVTDGRSTEALVCGAPNIAIGQRCLWAKTGAVLADGKELRAALIRGVTSAGMLLSARECGVGEDSSGLWTFTERTPLGTSLEELVTLEDTILDIELTPNRSDCLSHFGIAREIAAGLNLRGPQKKDIFETHFGFSSLSVIIEDPKSCPQYIARKFENITVAPSPLKLQTRLIRCEIRPINNLVDITNGILLEYGQPLHVFDWDRIEGGKIVVRSARSDEKILALDGKVYALDPEILVIADAKKPVAIAGVMGGKETSVNLNTRTVLLESAVFNRATIRKSRTKLGLSTESSYRFERGVTHWSCEMGSWKGSEDLESLTSGSHGPGQNIQSFSKESKIHPIEIAHFNKVLGLHLTPEDIAIQLQKLAIPILSKDAVRIEVQSPPWRLDLEQEIDFIEEVARMIGYTKIPSQGRDITLTPHSFSTKQTLFLRNVRQAMVSLGFFECLNYGFIASKELSPLESGRLIEIENPLSQEQTALRPTLLLELLKNLRTNASYQNREAKLFETGTVYYKKEGRIVEKTMLGALATGNVKSPFWKLKHKEPIDYFWIKGVLETLFSTFSIPKAEWIENPEHPSIPFLTHPQYSFELKIADRELPLGWCGLLHPKITKEEKLEDVALFELDLEVLESLTIPFQKMHPVLRTPKIKRDCSIWVPEEIPWSKIESEIKKIGGKLLRDCTLFDVYRDKSKKQEKSLSFTLTFQDPHSTLEDVMANNLREKIISHLNKIFKAELRSK